MSDSSFSRDRLEELLFASAGESFTTEERDELNALLRDNGDARSVAAQFLSLDAMLGESLGAHEAALRSTAVREKRSSKVLRFPLQQRAWLAAAAAVVVLLGVWVQRRRMEPVGVIQSATRTTTFNSGDAFRPGDWVRFEHGRVVVKFESGAKLAVEGPADFQIVNNNGARLIRGRATVRVPGKIKGFVLDTPAEQIVDLGTAFGVNVANDGATSVAVFEGSVELRGRESETGARQLLAGKAIRVEGRSQPPSEIPYEVRDYLQTWQTSFGVEAIEGAMRIAEPNERALPGKVVDSDRC